jgi:membrane fusion protein, peptide pheromone/bacteriocin exporter
MSDPNTPSMGREKLRPYLPENYQAWTGNLGAPTFAVYWFCLVIVAVTIAMLPFLYFDVSVRSPGILRPSLARAEIRAPRSGVIEQIYYKDGDFVRRGTILIRTRNPEWIRKTQLNTLEMEKRSTHITELHSILASKKIDDSTANKLMTVSLRHQVLTFVQRRDDWLITLKKSGQELFTDSILITHRTISRKEFSDKALEYQKLNSAYQAFLGEQLEKWAQDLAKLETEMRFLESERLQLKNEAEMDVLRAPTSGVIQGMAGKYAGVAIQQNDNMCTISPETSLIAECYLPSSSVGLVTLKQEVKLQIDTFDPAHFGQLTGHVSFIDNDMTLLRDRAIFKVLCSLDSSNLRLNNGYVAAVRKGLTLTAKFIIARRSAWQLIFDQLDDWLNPGPQTLP